MRGRSGSRILRLPPAGIAFAVFLVGCREPQLRPIPYPEEWAREPEGAARIAPPPPPEEHEPTEPTEIPPPPRDELRLPYRSPGRTDAAAPPAPWLREPRPPAPERPSPAARAERLPAPRSILPPIPVEQTIVAGVQYPIGVDGLFAGLSFSFDTRPELDPATGELLRRLRIHVLNDSGIEVRDLLATVRIGWLSFAHRARHFPPGALRFFSDAAEIRFPAIPSYPGEDPGRTASLHLSVPQEAAPVRIEFSRGTARSRTFVAWIPGTPTPAAEESGP